MSRVVMAALGSLGSVHPYRAVAGGLKSRGHQVTMVGAEVHRARFEPEGFAFHPVPTQKAADGRKARRFSVRNLLRHVDAAYANLLEACRGADLLISHPGAFTAPLVAEKLHIPWLSVALAPGTLFSVHDPPVLPFLPWLTHLSRIGSLPHSLIFRGFKRLTRGAMQPLDELRVREGLAASSKHPFFEGMFSPFGTLAWFSSLLAKPQRDWPPGCQVTGFPLPDNNRRRPALAPDLTAFLDAGEPPVVFTLGSVLVETPGNFYQESLEAARAAGCRAVLLTGKETPSLPSSKSVFVCAYAPNAGLFPRAAAAVHAGGISTLSETMSAGIPSLIVPQANDQYDNAFRAVKLGIARQESRKRYTGQNAAAHLRALLTGDGYRKNSKQVQTHVNAEDGVERACAAIETTLAEAGRHSSERQAIQR